jgi:hypothetical protein
MMNEEDYRRGYDDGFRAALDILQKVYVPNKTYVPNTTKEDIMWPDRMPTTTPFPQNYAVCQKCHIGASGRTNYVCMLEGCPSKVNVSYMYGMITTSDKTSS